MIPTFQDELCEWNLHKYGGHTPYNTKQRSNADQVTGVKKFWRRPLAPNHIYVFLVKEIVTLVRKLMRKINTENFKKRKRLELCIFNDDIVYEGSCPVERWTEFVRYWNAKKIRGQLLQGRLPSREYLLLSRTPFKVKGIIKYGIFVTRVARGWSYREKVVDEK